MKLGEEIAERVAEIPMQSGVIPRVIVLGVAVYMMPLQRILLCAGAVAQEAAILTHPPDRVRAVHGFLKRLRQAGQ